MAPRGRGGKFSKPSRGGGKRFSRDVQPVDKDGNAVGLWREPDDDISTSSEEEEDSEEESSEEDEAGPSSSSSSAAVPRNIGTIPEAAEQELTREERRALAKAKKAAAAARKSQGPAQPGDLPPSDSEDDDIAPNRNGLGAGSDDEDRDLPANPNHTSKSRLQTKPRDVDGEEVVGAAGGELSQLSRREREAIEAQQARERYMKLHAEGKTDEARADLARLALVKERREAERLRKEAEKEEKAELAKKRAEELEKKFAKGTGPAKKKGKK
ncbi:casein kinase substrate phosphoprotein PP28-domain-containing protein [Aspergillus pseudoustus]|uniref:Casein kinase substrate phosphoprotein PP28-domain-containing protein n=1 Tax=Aspergillus pseudoustus TaxID=1810923 RepID=A0ABR4JCE9_9EURO